MEVVCLSASDCRLLAARFAEHGNSFRRMRGALAEAGACAALDRLVALRKLERTFDVDLGSVCHRFDHRADPETHPIERYIIEYITESHADGAEGVALWVLLDRVHHVRELMEGRLVGEPGS